MLIITLTIFIWSIVINFFLYQQNREINQMRELEKNSYKLWVKEEVEAKKKEVEAKRIYIHLYEKTKQQRDLYFIKFIRAKRLYLKNKQNDKN